MRIKNLDIFGMLTIAFEKPVRTIENFDINLFRDLNPINLNLKIIPAMDRDSLEDFNSNSTDLNWTVSNETNLAEGILKIQL